MTQANFTGRTLEKFVRTRLQDIGYEWVERNRFIPARILGQPIYTNQFHIGKSIYGTEQNCDFIVYHPDRWPNNLIIEVKWQETGGSVDEKYPYLVLNIEAYPYPTVLVLDGGGYKAGAEKWIRSQSGHGKFQYVFNMQQFTAWANKGNL